MCMEDNLRVKVDIMGIIKLKFATRYVLELQEIFCGPSIKRNLLSIFLFLIVKVIIYIFFFFFGNNKVEMYEDGKVVGFLEPYVAIYIDLIYLIMV